MLLKSCVMETYRLVVRFLIEVSMVIMSIQMIFDVYSMIFFWSLSVVRSCYVAPILIDIKVEL
jgi:hypothetical protein